MKQQHQSFSVKESGLILDPMYPFVGASPDGVITCTCSSTRVLEICKNKGIKEVSEEKSYVFTCHRSWISGNEGQPLSRPVTNEVMQCFLL